MPQQQNWSYQVVHKQNYLLGQERCFYKWLSNHGGWLIPAWKLNIELGLWGNIDHLYPIQYPIPNSQSHYTTPHHGEISCTNSPPNCPAVDVSPELQIFHIICSVLCINKYLYEQINDDNWPHILVVCMYRCALQMGQSQAQLIDFCLWWYQLNWLKLQLVDPRWAR